MKSLLAVAAASTLLLAGCGAQPTGVAQLAAAQGLTAQAKHETQQLYGIVVKAKVAKAGVTNVHGTPTLTATLDVIDAVNTFDGSHVKGHVRITFNNPLNEGVSLADVKDGATIEVFIDYPLIDRTNNTIVPLKAPYGTHSLKVL